MREGPADDRLTLVLVVEASVACNRLLLLDAVTEQQSPCSRPSGLQPLASGAATVAEGVTCARAARFAVVGYAEAPGAALAMPGLVEPLTRTARGCHGRQARQRGYTSRSVIVIKSYPMTRTARSL